jgi:hypothetical protein
MQAPVSERWVTIRTNLSPTVPDPDFVRQGVVALSLHACRALVRYPALVHGSRHQRIVVAMP